jgi:hypothetical protein
MILRPGIFLPDGEQHLARLEESALIRTGRPAVAPNRDVFSNIMLGGEWICANCGTMLRGPMDAKKIQTMATEIYRRGWSDLSGGDKCFWKMGIDGVVMSGANSPCRR